MTKIFEWLETNAVKIIITVVIVWGLFFAFLYIQGIKKDIYDLSVRTNIIALEQEERQSAQFETTMEGLMVVVEQLEELAKQQAYVIDQNRAKEVTNTQIASKLDKPSYELLKSRTVFIAGCSDKVLSDEDRIRYGLGGEGNCWAGTGSVIKITDTETYIITNNHVSGKGEPNVTLYIQNGESKVVAQVVAQHPYVDMAVLKIPGKLEGKTAIEKIGTVNIQNSIYVVGNPLHNKMTYSEGVVANFVEMDMFIQAPLIYGNSGSGIYNSSGELVGLCYALQSYPWILGLPAPQITHSLCVDSISIKTFLKDLGLYND
jgi:S1-C subfamily serine protease